MLRNPDLSQINRILFFAVLITVVLYFGKDFFVLLIFSGFIAMLMTPFSNRLERRGISRVLTSIFSVMIIVAVIAGIIVLLSSQAASVSEDFPAIQARLQDFIAGVEVWINEKLGVSSDTLKSRASEAMSKAGGFITGMVAGVLSFIGSLMLVLVFTFLFLLHREKYENFVVMLSSEDKKTETSRVISKISKIAQKYLTGRLISIGILGILYLIGFTIIGLKNAILLSGIAALMTFIPYVGPVIGGIIPVFMALVSGSVNQALWVVVIMSLAQLFDNYVIEPLVVGGSVNISPFFTIFILILGGVLWGIAGVILFLPLLGILRIVFENVEGLQPYAYLIGDQKSKSATSNIWSKFKGLFSKNKK
jgi:predicted PurR-regulated permease PerM